MKVAALDLGTNTFLCLIAEVENSVVSRVIEDHVQVVRLGQGVQQTKEFHPEALVRAKKCLSEYAQVIKKHDIKKVKAVATSAARDVKNSQELFKICQDLNIPLEIISGPAEAQMTFAGALSNLTEDNKKRLVIDVGGGSTEYIVGAGKRLLQGQSLNIGCVRLTEKFLPSQPASTQNLKDLGAFIENEISKNFSNHYAEVEEIIAVAGTPTELAKIELGEFDPKKIDGYSISETKLKSWIDLFSVRTPEAITQDYGVSSGRSDVIMVGAMILQKSLLKFKKTELKVSTRGIRYGLAQSMISLLLALCLCFSFCEKAQAFTEKFEHKKIKVAEKQIIIEVADTEDKTEQGLMFRKKLDKDQGMLFVFEQELPRNFWMKNTFIPLSIGFFDKNKKLVDIQEMKAVSSEMEENPPTYPSKAPAMYALEMNPGWFKKNKIKIGDHFLFIK